MRLRIAEISTLTRPVPPAAEGSVESLVSLVTEGLVKKGHDVTLFAVAESRTGGRLVSHVPVSYTQDPTLWNWQVYEAYQASQVFHAWREFDIIHCHSYHFGLLFADFVPIPSLHTIHVDPGPDYALLARNSRNRHIHCCSKFQAARFEGLEGIHVVPHGIDMNRFQIGEDGGYLAFLGRFIPEKGPLQAIKLARETGIPLKMAAPHNKYFEEVIRPQLIPGLIEYVGEVKSDDKTEFLSHARALIYPLQRAEPFGLVMIEAMASGVPVVALNLGAVPEIVKHGVTGWVCESEQELLEGVLKVENLDRAEIRQFAVEHFSAQTMIGKMEELLIKIRQEHA